MLETELLALFEEAGPDAGGRAYSPALYRLFAARGEFDRQAGDDKREEWIGRAEVFADLSGDAETHVRARLLRGALWIESGLVRDALELTRELLRDYPAVRLRPFVLFQGATACDALGESSPALDLLDELERTIPDEPWTAQLRCQVPALRAQIFSGIGVVDLAARFVRQGRECLGGLDSVGANHAILMDVQTLNVELARGRFSRVAQLTKELLADERRYLPGTRWRGSILGARGEALLELAREAREGAVLAQAILEQALACDLSERDRLKVEVILAHQALAEGDDQQNVARARELLDGARGRMESWRARSGAAGPIPEELLLAAAEARLALVRGDELAELHRCRESLQAALERRMTTWNELTPLRQGGSGFLQDPSTLRGLAELSVLFLRSEGSAAAVGPVFDLWSRVQALGSISRALGQGAASLESVRAELLASGHGILAYLPGPSASLVIVLDRERAELVELPGLHELEAERQRLQRAREREDLAEERAAAAGLAELLMPPRVQSALEQWSAVTIVGAELLGHPPFAVLPMAGAGLLGVARAVDFLPSLPLGRVLARKAQEARARETRRDARDLVVVTAPRPSAELTRRFPELVPLPWSEEQARSWDVAPPGGEVRLFSGSAATLGVVRSALTDAFALQFLTHCVQDDRFERSSALVLGPSSGEAELLTCDAIEEGGVAPPLVVLGACRSSRGPLRRGDEGTEHLGGAFLRAGASVVVLSDEELDYGAAQRVSEHFFTRAFAFGDSPAEALRSALSRELAGNPHDIPLRGAHMVVLGLGQRRLVEVVPSAQRAGAPKSAPPESAPSDATGLGPLGWAAIGCCALAVYLGALAAWTRQRTR